MSNYHRRHFNGGKSVGVICMPFFSKKRIEAILDGKGEWGAFVVTILAILVFASTLSFSLDSVECIHRKYGDLLSAVDYCCLLFFTLGLRFFVFTLLVCNFEFLYRIHRSSLRIPR